MNSLLEVLRTPSHVRPSSARLFVITAFVVNAVLWGFNLVPSAPPEHGLPHMLVSLVIAGILVLRSRWTLVVGALGCVAQLVEGYIFLDLIITAIDGIGTLVCATLFFALALFGLIRCTMLFIQSVRAGHNDRNDVRGVYRWSSPLILLLVILLTAVVLQGMVITRSASARINNSGLAGLPTITSRNYLFEPMTIRVKAVDTMTLLLINADTVPHFFDIDEFDVRVPLPAGASTTTTIPHLQPGTYTFYCRPHGDKDTFTGMVGTLLVEG